jgi:hypothetical protein
MSDRINSLDNIIAVKEGANGIIGKLVYFTIGRCLIKEDKVEEIVADSGINKGILSKKFTNTHAFKSATKSLERKIKTFNRGVLDVYNIRILDNAKEQGKYVVREIKKEVIKEKQNDMIHLGNFMLDSEAVKKNIERDKKGIVSTRDAELSFNLIEKNIKEVNFDLKNSLGHDLYEECQKIVELYEYAKDCYNENRIVGLVEKYVEDYLDASPISIHGKVFFVPVFRDEELSKIEIFMNAINEANELDGNISIMTVPIMDEKRFVKEYTKEFYNMANTEIEIYQERLDYFIKSGQSNERVLNAWKQKIERFIEKKQKYSIIFKQELDELNGDMEILYRQMRELDMRMDNKHKELAKVGEGA